MRRRRATNEAEVIPASTAAQIGGASLLFGAIGNLLTVITKPGVGESIQAAGIWLSIVILIMAIAALLLPWDRWGPRSTLVLVPGAFAFIAFGNYTDPLPYVAGIYFVLLGAWVGLCHPRFTTLKLMPVFAFCYWWPLYIGPHLDRLTSSTLVITVVSVAIGEALGTIRTSLEHSRHKLAESTERRFLALTRNSVDVTFVFGLNNRIRHVSPAVRATFGYEPKELEALPLDRFLMDYVEGIDPADLIALLDGSYLSDADSAHEVRLLHADGRWIDVEASPQNLIDDPDINGIVIHVRDITGRKSLEDDLHYKAFHDDLTGLANRSAFRNGISDAKAQGVAVSVIYLDLDGFKAVNDTAGHKQGDVLLKLVAKRIQGAVPETVIVARLGGDEFAVLSPGTLDEAVELAGVLVSVLSEPFALQHSVVSIGASAGVAAADPNSPLDQAIGDADTAMYEAKASEAGRVVVFESHMRARLVQRLDMKAQLRDAITNEEFQLHYQPAIDLGNGQWIGAEALVRWNRPGVGMVPPGEFIGVAEESGAIVDLGRWILREACSQAMTWPTDNAPLWVAVNVSSRQFRDPDLLADIETALAVSGLEPDRLIIEITESVLMEDIEGAVTKLGHLRELGIRLAIDDFGTGYSSLSYLQRLPFDVLKIDRSFVVNAPTEPSDLSLLQTINRLGHDLGLRTLVEGIETQAQAELVRAVGCDFSQGFHFARPVPASELVFNQADFTGGQQCCDAFVGESTGNDPQLTNA